MHPWSRRDALVVAAGAGALLQGCTSMAGGSHAKPHNDVMLLDPARFVEAPVNRG